MEACPGRGRESLHSMKAPPAGRASRASRGRKRVQVSAFSPLSAASRRAGVPKKLAPRGAFGGQCKARQVLGERVSPRQPRQAPLQRSAHATECAARPARRGLLAHAGVGGRTRAVGSAGAKEGAYQRQWLHRCPWNSPALRRS
eukprot:scaffold547_cov384-Prasinococcus_capsulatus_cf.AAC.33